MMNNSLTLAWVAGLGLGGMFFGGLWWTVRAGVSSTRPGPWFVGSAVVRTGLALGGFYLVASGRVAPLLACLAGFVTARIAVTWLTRPSAARRARPAREASDAP